MTPAVPPSPARKAGTKTSAATRAGTTKGAGTSGPKSAGTLAAGKGGARAAPKAKPLGGSKAARGAAHARASTTFELLRAAYPDAHCELDHQSPFQLLVATVLSAQTTDVRVNLATPSLFAAYPDAARLALAPVHEVAQLLKERGLGMYQQKAKNIVGLAGRLVEHHGGRVPSTLAELIELPGVGRKTANVVLGVAFGAPEGVVVDTHVQRLAQRLGWTNETEPGPIELDLCRLFPRDRWDILSHTLIFHGRRACFAQKPACAGCPVAEACPSAFAADQVGRKKPRAPRRTPAG